MLSKVNYQTPYACTLIFSFKCRRNIYDSSKYNAVSAYLPAFTIALVIVSENVSCWQKELSLFQGGMETKTVDDKCIKI